LSVNENKNLSTRSADVEKSLAVYIRFSFMFVDLIYILQCLKYIILTLQTLLYHAVREPLFGAIGVRGARVV